MTEQEKREKAIEEMAQLGSIVCNGCDCSRCANCVHYRRAEIIYDAGYRKADEVYNEAYTSGKKDGIIDFVQTVIRCLKNEPYLHTCLRAIAFHKFGVEVEE